MSYGLHINQNPSGTFSYVGSIPVELMDQRKATRSDVMGGRSINGVAYYNKGYETVQELVDRAKAAGAKLCESPRCSCRKLF